MQIYLLMILCFLLTGKATTTSSPPGDHISIDCGSTAAASTSLRGREWLGDFHPKLASSIPLQVEGSSTRSSVHPHSLDPLPYDTARISPSQFSYIFHLNPGQKFIRLHFNPASYHGFHSFDDYFTVDAGPFTLLANFSASIAAHALSLNTFVKEFCVIIPENQPFNLVFTPSTTPSKLTYAFINGIEIISVPPSLNYCHGGDIGVQVVGTKSLIYIDSNSTALELVHRQNIKWGFVSSGDDITGMFGMWAATEILKENRVYNKTWRVSVDVGFRYLVRIHFCELGLKMAEAGRKDFKLVINQMVVSTSGDLLQERGNQSNLMYKNYMVIVEGHKREGKRDIFLSLQSDHVFLDRHGPLEGFEVFKLNNHDYNLASPNPLPPKRDSPLRPMQILLSLLGRRNAIATVIFAAICLVNIIAYMLQQTSVSKFTEEEENKPSTRAKQLCRRFSLAEIQSATDNFYDAFVIGKGGFGKVYKGLIDNGREAVAIKRLKPDSKQGKREFWTEVETLSELRHVNLVSLIGYCNDQPENILVYEYMPCGTLADHLYKLARKNNAHHPLSWKQRLQICIGAGRGLDYLHTGLENEIIHRDVKASNILLDEKFVAKVSDFGLAKIKSGSKSQNEASTNLKGTFGYIDPDYFRSHRLSIESDTYSFGVVLLEVLCGRPAVEPWFEEDRRSLTMWARDNIVKGQVDDIVDPSLREEISPDSLKTFVRIAENCLLDEPKKRPAIAHVVMILQFALEQHDTESLLLKERARIADIFPSSDKSLKENANSSVPNERTNVGDADVLPGDDRTIISVSTRPSAASSNVQNVTSPLREQINSHMISSRKKDEKKSVIHKLSRKLWPWDELWTTGKSSKKKDVVSHALSAPMNRRTSNSSLRGSSASRKLWPWDELWKTGKSSKKKDMFSHALSAPVHRRTGIMELRGSAASGISSFSPASGSDQANPRSTGQVLPQPNLRVFTFSELKIATRNFRSDTVLGEGGFGKVYKGWLDEKTPGKAGSGTVIAVKKLHSESMQGFQEWQSEVNFLGRLSHPNVVRLLGYCWEDKELLLVYEFMQKGSLEKHLFGRGSAVQPLPWNIRLKILIAAANGLAFLHASERKVIYRDFKASNILLDGSYHAKLSDFGLAKMGPIANTSHVTTQVMGTHGYAAPEYIATGHLYVKSDVYGFGVVLVEMLTGLRALDTNRPAIQQNLVDWIKPRLSERRKLKHIIDSRLEGRFPTKSAFQIAQLARNCLEVDPKNRPSMKEVVEILQNMDAAVEKPRQPRVHFS
ncbi:hypothetical protein ACS0TY_011774 [Phlomoides rotata]